MQHNTLPTILPGKLGEYCEIPAIHHILTELRAHLPAQYLYHSFVHTVEVLRDSISYAFLDGLTDLEIRRIAIAAAYHDAGYLVAAHNHEEESVRIFRAFVAKFGECSEEDIEIVSQIILDTRVVQPNETYWRPPKHPLSRYVLDADVSNLGREDFFYKTDLLRQELNADQSTFLRQSLSFIERHRWFTLPAKQLRQAIKDRNIVQLRQQLGVVVGCQNHRSSLPERVSALFSSSLSFFHAVLKVLQLLTEVLDGDTAVLFLASDRQERIRVCFTRNKGEWDDASLSRTQVLSAAGAHFGTIGSVGSAGAERGSIAVPLAPFSMDMTGVLHMIGSCSAAFGDDDLVCAQECAERVSLVLTALFQGIEMEQRTGLNYVEDVSPRTITSSWGRALLTGVGSNEQALVAFLPVVEQLCTDNGFTITDCKQTWPEHGKWSVVLEGRMPVDSTSFTRSRVKESGLGVEASYSVPLFNECDWKVFQNDLSLTVDLDLQGDLLLVVWG